MNTRLVALRTLLAVVRDHEYLHLALKKQHLDDMREQRFVTALVSAVLQNFYKIDYVLKHFVQIERTDPVVMAILRLGAAQILEMDGVPVHAAVNESVKLAGRERPRAKGLVNAVLHRVANSRSHLRFPDPDKDFVGFLHVFYSYPTWICRLFIEEYGPDMAERLVSYQRQHNLTGIRIVRPPLALASEPGIYLDDAAYLQGTTRLDSLEAFQSGEITAQSESSMLCVRAAGIRPGSRVLDLCAAPGGKTAYAAQLAGSGQVTACDVHPHRVRLVEQTAKRLGLSNVTALEADAREWHPEWEHQFDVVLVDAPCSALGLLYRKPDIKIFKAENDLRRLSRIQRQILANAAGYVAPGGALVYSTCTIDRIENQDNADWFLRSNPGFSSASLGGLLPGRLGERGVRGAVQLLPPLDNIDGFYIARFEKHADATG